MVELAAILACVILAALVIFQILLIAGVPLGRFAWGGSHTVLPNRLRVASAFSVVLYIVFAMAILSKAGIISDFSNSKLPHGFMWLLTGYFFIGIIMNSISRSKPERIVMTPVVTLLALLFFYTALS